MLSAEGLKENIRMKLYLDGNRQIERNAFLDSILHQSFAQIINILTKSFLQAQTAKSFLARTCSYSEFYMKDVYGKNKNGA